MKELKLEVGKTYRNRKGEEVKIREFAEGFKFPYRGDEGKWYRESGQWGNAESSQDLVEEVTRHTFIIPEGTKGITVEQVSNRIVVEMVPEKEPKPGDVMINFLGNVYIFKEVHYYGWHNHFAHLDNVRVDYNGFSTPGRPATPEEAQPLWDALKKAGKRWNPETMQVEDVPEKVMLKEGDVVFEDGRIMIVKMYPNYYHAMFYTKFGNLFINGNYGIPFTSAHFRIATPDEAQLLFDALKKDGKRWNSETMQVEDVPEIDRILEWVEANLESALYDRGVVAKVIEDYLKHREGEQ